MSSARLAASAAIATGVLSIAGAAVIPEGPETTTATAEQITAYYAEHTSLLQASIVLWSAAAAVLVIFAAVTSTLLRRSGAAPELTAVITVAGSTTAALMLAAQGPMGVGIRENFSGADDATRRTVYILSDLTYNLGDLILPAAGLLVAALSLAAFGRHVLPRWLGYLGAPIAAAALLGALAPVHGQNPGIFEMLEVASYMTWPLWTIATGVALAVRKSELPQPGPQMERHLLQE